MDPITFTAGMIQDNAIRHLLFVVVALFVLIGACGLVIALGEKAFGFDIKGAINAIEASADRGDSAGVTAVAFLLTTGIACISWVAVTVIRP